MKKHSTLLGSESAESLASGKALHAKGRITLLKASNMSCWEAMPS